jgi:hypothetical protein
MGRRSRVGTTSEEVHTQVVVHTSTAHSDSTVAAAGLGKRSPYSSSLTLVYGVRCVSVLPFFLSLFVTLDRVCACACVAFAISSECRSVCVALVAGARVVVVHVPCVLTRLKITYYLLTQTEKKKEGRRRRRRFSYLLCVYWRLLPLAGR